MKEQIINVPASADGTRLSVWLAGNGYPVTADCGGKGTCGKCRIRVLSGTFYSDARKSAIEEPDADGMIRSCHAWCSETGASLCLTETVGGGLTAVAVHPEHIAHNGTSDGTAHLGAALDIGTTTLAMALVNLDSGETVSTVSRRNPQRSFGADVMSRIGAAAEGDNLSLMQSVLLDEIRAMTDELCKNLDAASLPRTITVAGNTTMLHLFCGVSPAGMGAYPFTPAFLDNKTLSGDTLGLPFDTVIVLPGAHAFIGGDVTAGVLLLRLAEEREPVMLIDIGTNGEMVLFTGLDRGGRFFAASAAAGPALEGAGISTGVGGIAGAVSAAQEVNGQIVTRTIGERSPIGICGSGLIDLAAILLARGDLDETGYLEDDPFPYAETEDGTPLTLTQEDIRALQLAKSAMRAGMEALCDAAGIPLASLSRIYVAGGLGYYMNMDSATAIGLLPEELRTKLVSVGNTSLGGASLLLSEPLLLERICAEAASYETIDLNKSAAFNEGFITHMMFPSDEEDW
ncbi:MAG: DUF4445 domain-containing protein [Ruminococcaceae bacterium]|nr:DUF4445 domain-containing protein [Oscillospiraceae bacterium]